MAITGTNQASIFSGTNLTSYATGSRTPTANKFSIAKVTNDSASGTPTTPTLSGNGLTWSQLDTYVWDTSGGQARTTVFVAKNGASPSAGAVTADFGGVSQAGCNVIVDEIAGDVDVSGTALQTIVQYKRGGVDSSDTSDSITMDAAITSGNATWGGFSHQAEEGHTPGNGHTELVDNSRAGPACASCTMFKAAGSQTVSASWTTSSRHGGFALEIKAAASGQTVTANQTTETDTSQAITRRKSKTVAQSTETDTPQSITRQRRYAVAQVSESDSAQSITFRTQQAVSQVIETDSAQQITARKIKSIGQVSETETAQSITPAKRLTINQCNETDTAQPITEAGAGQIIVTVNQVQESDAAQAIARVKIRIVAQISESDLAQQLFPAKRVAIAQTFEVDAAQAFTEIKIRAIAQALETDSAQVIAWSPKRRLVNQAIETDAALAITNANVGDVVELHLYARSMAFTLHTRDKDLSLHIHATALTLEEL